ncbi:MAG: Rpn family recombination-promoting nuclease/putative transposase [Blastocatellia bacterium]
MSYLTNPHDHFFKDLFSRPEVAADFLANYLPPEIVAALDLGSLELIKDSFVDDALRSHLSDLLYRLRLRGGGDAYVCLLFEHKSEPDDWVAWQTLRYKVRAWEMQLRQGATRLSPIIPVVFYHGSRQWQVPREFGALIEFGGHDALREFELGFLYYLCDLSSYDVGQIKGMAILQAGLRLMRTIFTDEFEATLEEVFDLLLREQEPSAMEYLRTILRYAAASRKKFSQADLQAVVEKKLPKPEGIKLMETLAETWMEQGLQKGLQQGLQQARLEDSQTLAERALRAIQRKFGAIEEETQARVRALKFDQILDLIEAFLDFNSANDLADWLRGRAPADSEEKIN